MLELGKENPVQYLYSLMIDDTSEEIKDSHIRLQLTISWLFNVSVFLSTMSILP